MIALVAGLLLGAGSGLLLGFIPGMSLGFVFLLLPHVSPLFAGGFVIGCDATSSMIKQLNILTPAAIGENVYLAHQLPRLLKEGRGIEAVMTSTALYTFFKVGFCLVGIVMLATGTAEHLNIPPEGQRFLVMFPFVMWLSVLEEANYRKECFIILAIAATLGILTVKISGSNNMFALSTSLFGISSSIQLIKSQRVSLPAQKQRGASSSFETYPVIGGAMSALIWGTPTSLWLKSYVEEDKNDCLQSVKVSAVAEGTASALSLILTLAVGSSRSTSAKYINSSLGEVSPWLAAGLLGFTVIFTLMISQVMPSLINFHLNTIGLLNQKVMGYSIVAVSAIAVLFLMNWIGIFVIGASLFIQKAIEATESPQELTLISISAVSMLSLIGF